MLAWSSGALGIGPRYLSDEELASYPIQVVAQWEKADFTHHHQYQDAGRRRDITRVEAYTQLHIQRVIEGDSFQPDTVALKSLPRAHFPLIRCDPHYRYD
jgi:hypothetical protein